MLKVPAISKQFMKNFEHNAKLAEEGKMVGILSYNNRNVIKPLEVVNETLVYEEECKATGQPVTIAGLCHKLRC